MVGQDMGKDDTVKEDKLTEREMLLQSQGEKKGGERNAET
jgi:hypothetical protein